MAAPAPVELGTITYVHIVRCDFLHKKLISLAILTVEAMTLRRLWFGDSFLGSTGGEMSRSVLCRRWQA